MASLHNLSRTIGTALLFSVSGKLTFGVILAEMCLYHIYKVARKDYVLWVFGLEGALTYSVAALVHSVVKVLVDYTGMIHARGPKLMGGAMFVFLSIYSQLLPFAALHFYEQKVGIEHKADVVLLRSALLGLLGLWTTCIGLFIWVTKRAYLSTFYQKITASQFTIESFRKANSHEAKILTCFDNHISLIAGIKTEVKEYTLAHWHEFEGKSWLTKAIVSQIPDEFIPTGALARVRGGVGRRRKSVSVREILGMDSE